MSEFDLEQFGDSPRIVVTVRDHMSGVLYSVPTLRAIRKRWPNAKITLVTSSYSAPILDGGSPYIDRILPLYSFSDTPKRTDRLVDIGRKLSTWARLVRRVDLVIHLRDVGGGTLLFCSTLGKPVQVGYQQGGKNEHLTLNVGRQDVSLGSRQRNRLIIEAMGIEPDGDHMELNLAAEDVAWAKEWLRANGHDGSEPVTVVHPGSHWGCNQWIPERWTETIDRILDERGGMAVITGVERELPLAERIAGPAKGRVAVAAGQTTLGRYAAMIGEADLLVAIDAAPTQISQALDIPSVIMMGAGTPAWNGPVEGEPMIMLQKWDNDNPRPELCRWADGACNSSLCTSRLEDIEVSLVLDSIDEVAPAEAR